MVIMVKLLHTATLACSVQLKPVVRVRIQCHGKNISGFYFHLSQNMSSLVEVFCRNGNQVFVWGWRNLVIGGFVIEVSTAVLQAPVSNAMPRNIVLMNSLPFICLLLFSTTLI